MPNWCENSVTFTHKDPAEIRRLVTAFNEGRLLSEFLPLPEELSDTTSPMPADQSERAAQLREKYGSANWYDWQVTNWGTKWDVSTDDPVELKEGANTVSIYFNSAWAPPINWYQHMEEECGFAITAYYYEPGMAFCGIYEDGSDAEFNLPETSAEVKERIPADLDEAFNITENIAMWEEEEAEEESSDVE